LVISHEISAERGYFKVPHLGHWFVLVRFVNFNRFTLRYFPITNFSSFYFIFSPKVSNICIIVHFLSKSSGLYMCQFLIGPFVQEFVTRSSATWQYSIGPEATLGSL
jgi:hypothetical protein